MKFAFSTLGCPQWDFETIVAKASEYGYQGVEVRGFLNESILTSANIFLSDPAKVRKLFEAAGIQIACLSSSVAMTQGQPGKNARAAGDLIRFIDTAEMLGCPYVKVFDTQVPPAGIFRPGVGRDAAAVAYAKWLAPMCDYAAEHNVTILIENALSFRNAKELWIILEMLNHPSAAVCWDLFNAALIGEPPSVSVPTLNNRIQYAQVRDALLGPLGATFCKLGEGSVKVPEFLRRLKGIGYTGWVTLEWEKAWLPNLAEPEEIFPHAIEKLREWTTPQLDEKGDATPKPQEAGA